MVLSPFPTNLAKTLSRLCFFVGKGTRVLKFSIDVEMGTDPAGNGATCPMGVYSSMILQSTLFIAHESAPRRALSDRLAVRMKNKMSLTIEQH
jgi:hypothetical protein